jgi:signal transduction histidine kinase/ligand-binding sensor domain-containing protein
MSNPRRQQLTRHSSLVYPEPFGRRATRKFFFLACTVLLCTCDGFALDPALDISQYAHTAWKVRDGFARGAIFAIAQTPDGYLWLGTEFGLLRFDGVRAVPWQPPGGEELPSDFIRSLLVAHDGTLWIGTFKGLASWKDGNLTHYPELAGQMVDALLEDRERTVWAAGAVIPSGRLCSIHDGRPMCYGEDGSFGQSVESLYQDSRGNLWVAGDSGLWRWKPGSPKHYALPDIVNTGQVLSEDGNGALLIALNGGIGRLAGDRVETYRVPAAGQQFAPNRLFRDRNGGLWVTNRDHGLVHVHQGRTDSFGQSDGLSGDAVQTIFEDREGSIWVATLSGLDRFREYAVDTISVKQGLSDAFVWSVLAARDGSVWLGTFDGLNRWKDGEVSIYRSREAPAARTESHAAIRQITDSGLPGTVQSLFEDDRGRIWASTRSGVSYFENGRFISVSGVPGGNVYSIAVDGVGDVWISNDDYGLFRLLREQVVERIPWARVGGRGSAGVLVPDPSRGGLWLGFWQGQGGAAYFKDGQVRATYAAADGLGEGKVSGLQLDRDGTLWAATERGLSRIRNGRVATLTSKNGLPCDTVHWSMEDDEHSVWLYMACGLVRMSRGELDAWSADPNRGIHATVFDSFDGVTNRANVGGYGPHVTKSPDGRIWFVAVDGVTVIDPHHLPFNKLPPPVHVEQITADHKTFWRNWTGDAFSASSSGPKLPALVRDLTIDYTALSLVVPEKVHFRYKLEGWDRDWQDAGTRRQAFYTNLSPRKYRFRVMACNNSGVWNEEGAALDFVIPPAWYQTNWFRVLCVAAFLVLLWALYQLRLRQLARQFNMRLEERVGERTRIARDLHDTLLQSFQGLMFRLQAVRDMLPGRTGEAIEALDIALERGDKAIMEGRDTVSDLHEPLMGDSDIVEALTALGKELAEQSGNGTAPRVHVLLEGKPRDLNPMLRDEIYRIGREALRNAFRHARAQEVEAQVTYSDAEFLLHCRDDGVGIDPKVASQGARAGHWGLPGMRERAQSFGGKLEVWSEAGAGTEIKLAVPAAIAYGRANAGRRFWFWRKKMG